MTDKLLKDAAETAPDPGRALRNLESFAEENPSYKEKLQSYLREISILFGSSQFLANYCSANPEMLFRILPQLDSPTSGDDLRSLLKDNIEELKASDSSLEEPGPFMNAVRRFRMAEILKITLRDILHKADITDVFVELSRLADVTIDASLALVRQSLTEKHGAPQDDRFSVITLGKLGAEELNFSSDIDLMYVYGDEDGETSGVASLKGVSKNRISNHEYYCKVGELLGRFLSMNTDCGFAYRVDLRLRPEGQRGALALSLSGYENYYESWGRAWERAMLIRARPVGGDKELGEAFIRTIRPFVYRKYLDFSAIEEIRSLKTRIDATFKKGDIKRGYGGIREIEFFTQALQLIYGGRDPVLRERSTLRTLHLLMQKSLVGQDDYSALLDNYCFLRTVEHRLQQLNDIQTHALPSSAAELEVLARKMGVSDAGAFSVEIDRRRSKVRSIYESLFAEEQKTAAPQSGMFSAEELSDQELREYLEGRGLKDVMRGFRSIRLIMDSMYAFQTLRGRRLLSEILPLFIDAALRSQAPDDALNRLQSFAALLCSQESYLEIFIRDRKLIDLMVYIFSESSYLSKLLISRPKYLEMMGWQEDLNRSLSMLTAEMKAATASGQSANDVIRLMRQSEEIRLGLLFLQKKMPIGSVVRGLSKIAEAILIVLMESFGKDAGSLAVIGMGKLGGREINFGSDLDLIFVTAADVTAGETRTAERLLRMLSSFTKDGMAYRVDTRLRPEGSKGPLVSSVEALRKYYLTSARTWELQALLRARPVAGDQNTGREFLSMAGEVLRTRGAGVRASDIQAMRQRIMHEHLKKTSGYDIKLGVGGLEDIEFTMQFLQLLACGSNSSVLVQNTLMAVRRLSSAGVIAPADAGAFEEAYILLRTVESLMRLRGDEVLGDGSAAVEAVSGFVGHPDVFQFRTALEMHFSAVRALVEKYLRDA